MVRRIDAQRLPLACLALMATMALAACGSSSVAGGTPPTSSPTPSGPPKASGTAKGDANVAGNIKVSSVLCGWPETSGQGIRVFAQPEGQPPSGVQLVILIQAHAVNVRAATGSGATYGQREFNGTGVSEFDGAGGGKVDTTLTEDKAAGINPGTVGAVTSVTMTVDCANQQPGSAAVAVTGNAPGGPLSGQLTSARVVCATYPQGKTANITALTRVGGRTVLIIVGVTWLGISVSTDGHYYANSDTASGTASDTGGHWSGDVTEQSSGSKLHVAGDATCGSSTKT